MAYFQPKNVYFTLSGRCLWGVCWVSGGCQGPSGLCFGYINAKSIASSPVDIIFNMYCIFSQWPIFGQKRRGGLNFQRGVVGHFPAFQTIFFVDQQNQKNNNVLLISLGGPMGPIHPVWGHVLVSFFSPEEDTTKLLDCECALYACVFCAGVCF